MAGQQQLRYFVAGEHGKFLLEIIYKSIDF